MKCAMGGEIQDIAIADNSPGMAALTSGVAISVTGTPTIETLPK
jgi:hypothetical protein